MGLLSRLVSTNDTLMALLPLLEKPPWVRRRAGKNERWTVEGGMRWSVVDPADRLKLGQYEIQVWMRMKNMCGFHVFVRFIPIIHVQPTSLLQ